MPIDFPSKQKINLSANFVFEASENEEDKLSKTITSIPMLHFHPRPHVLLFPTFALMASFHGQEISLIDVSNDLTFHS